MRAEPKIEQFYWGNIRCLISNYDTTVGNQETAIPIIFLHGLSMSKETIAQTIVKYVTREARERNLNLRLLAFDFPGFGNSNKNLANYTLENLSEILIKFMDNKKIKKAWLYGESMGAMVAIITVAKYPERFFGIGIHGTPIDDNDWQKLRKKLKYPIKLARKISKKIKNPLRLIPDKLLENIMRQHGGLVLHNYEFEYICTQTPYKEEFLRAVKKASFKAVLDLGECIFQKNLGTQLEILAAQKLPTLIIDGDSPKLLGVDTKERIKRAIPHSQMLIVPNAGHAATLMKPNLVAKHLVNFIIEKSGENPIFYIK